MYAFQILFCMYNIQVKLISFQLITCTYHVISHVTRIDMLHELFEIGKVRCIDMYRQALLSSIPHNMTGFF